MAMADNKIPRQMVDSSPPWDRISMHPDDDSTGMQGGPAKRQKSNLGMATIQTPETSVSPSSTDCSGNSHQDHIANLEHSQRELARDIDPDESEFIPETQYDVEMEEEEEEEQGKYKWNPAHLETRFHVKPRPPPPRYQKQCPDQPDRPCLGDPVIKWLQQLCKITNTGKAFVYLERGVRDGLADVRSELLIREAESQGSYQVKIFSLSIWLTVCYRLHCKAETLSKLSTDACHILLHCGLAFVAHQSQLEADTAQLLKFGHEIAFHDPGREGHVRYWESVLRYTHGKRYSQWFSSLPMDVELFQNSDRNPLQRRLLDTLERDGLVALAEEIIDIELKSPTSPFKDARNSMSWMKTMLVQFMVTIDRSLLKSMIRNDVLVRSLRGSDSISTSIRNLRDRGDEVPAIYGNFLADGSGMGPTPFHTLQITSDARKYISSCVADDEVDTWSRHVDLIWYPQFHSAQPEARRYADTKRRRNGLAGYWLDWSQARRDRITKWIRSREQAARVAVRKGQGLVPSTSPQVNIGYSDRPVRRLKQHKQHSNSNYLMNLVEALVFTRYGPKIGIQQLILANCWDPAHPWFGEIAVTDMIQGYIESGHGFAYCPAGLSNRSMHHRASNEDRVGYVRRIERDGTSLVAVMDQEICNQTRSLEVAVAEKDLELEELLDFEERFMKVVLEEQENFEVDGQ